MRKNEKVIKVFNAINRQPYRKHEGLAKICRSGGLTYHASRHTYGTLIGVS